MSRLENLFKERKSGILNVYCTAGYPHLDNTIDIIRSLEKHGADIIEIGIPYSDPLADGPVIQESSSVAISNGMTLAVLFEQLKDIRKQVTIPVILMGYMNPVMQYGFEKFCHDAAAAGIDGFILPDLPMYEYDKEYGAILEKYGLDLVFLVTPETSDERIRMIDSKSRGFLYAVSSSSTTGNRKELSAQDNYFRRLKEMNLKNPVLIGFGIRDRESFDHACNFAPGAIIGTAFIQAIQHEPNLDEGIGKFIQSIRGTNPAISGTKQNGQ